MNNEESSEGVSEIGEGAEREIVISGTVVENAVGQLREVDSGYSLEGADLAQLNRDIFGALRRAGKAETPEEETRLLREADALQKVADLARPNNSIAEIIQDEQGKISGMKVRVKELKQNP